MEIYLIQLYMQSLSFCDLQLGVKIHKKVRRHWWPSLDFVIKTMSSAYSRLVKIIYLHLAIKNGQYSVRWIVTLTSHLETNYITKDLECNPVQLLLSIEKSLFSWNPIW